MLSFLLSHPCDECNSVSGLLKDLDTAIARYGKKLWLRKAFSVGVPISKIRLKTLLYYKDILQNLQYDPFYYGPKFPYSNIDSRIKALINGLH